MSGREFLAANGVHEALAAAVLEVLHTRPAQPLLAICKFLAAKEAAKREKQAAAAAAAAAGGSGAAVSHADRFLLLWRAGASDQTARDELEAILDECPLAGRVIHGELGDPSFGELLSADSWKRASWVFGADALREGFLGLSAREVCLRLGMGQSWLDAKLHGPRPKLFQLCIFPAASVAAERATWAGVARVLESQYPEAWPRVQHHLPTIQSMPFADIQAQAGYDMLGANLAGRDPSTGESPSEHYMSLQRFLRLGPSPSLVQVRQFLWDELGLKGLFRGDGFTYDDHGERGYEEFLACNLRLREIQGAAVMPLSRQDLLST